MLLLAAALAAPSSDPLAPVLAWPLREALRLEAAGQLDAWRYRRLEVVPAEGPVVVVEGSAFGAGLDGEALAELLEAEGFTVERRAAQAVQLQVPWDELRRLASLPGVTRVREPWVARVKDVTEGYAAVMVQDWHDDGVTGAGVRIGIVDVGFHNAEAAQEDGELPANVQVDFSRGDEHSTSHGTAVAEVIADFAPDAELYLASFSTDVEFGEVMEAFADYDLDVVNGSIGFDNVWHADGTSSLSIYAQRAVEHGAVYVAAAGNENDKYRVGPLTSVEGEVAIAGEVGVGCYSASGFVSVSFRWSEPFLEASRDVDLVVYNEDGSICGTSEDVQDGKGWPFELVEASGCSDRVRAVPVSSEDVAGLEGYLYGTFGIEEASWTNTEDLTLPGDVVDGVSVGAWYVDEAELGYYSSRGPTNDGRTKPDVVAPTGVTTSTYGRYRFDGSSAAAPHVAGLAALWVEATRRQEQPRKFTEWVQEGALDLGEPGLDNEYGAGLAQADELPPKGCGCAQGGPASGAVVLLAALLLRRRACS